MPAAATASCWHLTHAQLRRRRRSGGTGEGKERGADALKVKRMPQKRQIPVKAKRIAFGIALPPSQLRAATGAQASGEQATVAGLGQGRGEGGGRAVGQVDEQQQPGARHHERGG